MPRGGARLLVHRGRAGICPRDLRALQDWFLRYQLNAVPGVAEVASVGERCGSIRLMWIQPPARLPYPLSAVVDAVMRSNRNVGGNVVEASGTWSVIRGLGLIENISDIEHIIGAGNGVPIFVRRWQRSKSVMPSGQCAGERHGRSRRGCGRGTLWRQHD